MSSVAYLREFVNERLTAAAEEIFAECKNTNVTFEYDEELDRQQRLWNMMGMYEWNYFNNINLMDSVYVYNFMMR